MSVATAVRGALSPAEEKFSAKELSPPVAWPTLALAVFLPAAFWTLVAAGFFHRAPLWACVPALSVLSYAHYTLVHESIHGNLVPGAPRLRWLNALVGWVGALGMGLSWPMLMRTHVLHHAHTNTDEDPDIFVKGTFAELLIKLLFYVPISLIPLPIARRLDPAQYQSVAKALRPAEVTQDTLVSLATLASLGLAILFGRWLDWLCLFFIPTRIGALLLAVFFQWLPHAPFDRTERYHNTRISLWPGGALLTLQQNLHLMHHLWPSVPFYNYARLYRRMRPTLVSKGSPIQGLLVGRYAKDKTAH